MQDKRVLSARDAHTIRFVIRSRFAWTFFGMGLFVALCLLFCGIYLLADAIREPLEASESVILAGGATLALASFLLTYLVWPRAIDFRKRLVWHRRYSFRHPGDGLYTETAHARFHAIRDNEHMHGPM